MGKRLQKTQGYTWLEHSFTAFNGSGYANRSSPEAFVASYITYSRWKKRLEGVKLATEYYQVLVVLAADLIENSTGPGQQPNAKQWAKYQHFKEAL